MRLDALLSFPTSNACSMRSEALSGDWSTASSAQALQEIFSWDIGMLPTAPHRNALPFFPQAHAILTRARTADRARLTPPVDTRARAHPATEAWLARLTHHVSRHRCGELVFNIIFFGGSNNWDGGCFGK